MMSSWKASLVVGFVLGSILLRPFGIVAPDLAKKSMSCYYRKMPCWLKKKQALQESFEALETQKALELEEAFEQLTKNQAELEQQKVDYEKQLAQLKQQQKKVGGDQEETGYQSCSVENNRRKATSGTEPFERALSAAAVVAKTGCQGRS